MLDPAYSIESEHGLMLVRARDGRVVFRGAEGAALQVAAVLNDELAHLEREAHRLRSGLQQVLDDVEKGK